MIICGTGHRPQDLPCKFEKRHPWKIQKLKELEKYLSESEVKRVISGMALGFDQWLAFVSIKLNIPTIAYVPFKGQESNWNDDFQNQYHKLLEKCESVLYVCDGVYSPAHMHKRNEKMVDDSDYVLALWNPEKKKGGTYSCVSYAMKSKKKIINLWGDSPDEINN